MKISHIAAAGLMLMMPTANSNAAELKIFAGGGMTPALNELAPAFEKASGHKLKITYGTTPNLIKMISAGESFDAGVVPVDVMKDSGARAKFVSGPTIDVARVG